MTAIRVPSGDQAEGEVGVGAAVVTKGRHCVGRRQVALESMTAGVKRRSSRSLPRMAPAAGR
jgi:hypothetical protein